MSQLRRDFGPKLPKYQVIIPNGIPLDNPHPAVDYETARIAVLGRLSKEKGVDMAIRAFDIIRREVPDATLVIIGEGQESENLHKLATQLGIKGSIIRFARPFDINELALQTVSLLSSPETLRSMGENGYNHARNTYNLEEILNRFERILTEP